MATVSVNMERYNEDEVGVSVWACPIYGGGRVVWCGLCLRLRVGVSSCSGGGVVGSAEGREEVVTHQLTAHTAHVHSTGGDKQEVLHVHTHAWTGGTQYSKWTSWMQGAQRGHCHRKWTSPTPVTGSLRTPGTQTNKSGHKQQAGTPHTSQHQQHTTHNIELYTSVSVQWTVLMINLQGLLLLRVQ